MAPDASVTLLFTDIAGSVQLWERDPERMSEVLARHDELLRAAIEAGGGRVFKTVGDAVYAVFDEAGGAIPAAIDGQRAIRAADWGGLGPLEVRMALHTGPVEVRDGDVYGPTVNRVARLLAAGHGGQVLLSSATGELVRGSLPAGAGIEDLGLHELRDLPEPVRVHQLLHPDLPRSFPPLRAVGRAPHNLPRSRTRFVGRDRDVAAVRERLAEAPIVTLTGIGGTGKTRLALEVAAGALGDFTDGVWLVELAPLHDPGLVPRAVADALGTKEEAGRPLVDTLVDGLRPRALLLVLDNCEHLLDACAELADVLLEACPRLRILATSREPLRVGGESVWPVQPLEIPRLPATGAWQGSIDDLAGLESVRLFVERARSVQPAFELSDENAEAVARICARLDGIPLAIELAAARVKGLPPGQLADRLDDRFRYLTGGHRTSLPRQRTLRAAIDWSYDLLDAPERALLARLSVFRGSFDLVAVETVCGGAPLEEARILDLVADLVLKSLVEIDEEAVPVRYRMLETVREYAAEKLVDRGEAPDHRSRHTAHYRALAEDAAGRLTGSEQTTWLERLELDHDNLRAALAWSLGAGDAEGAVALGASLGRFWSMRGHYADGRAALDDALGVDGPVPPGLRAEALVWAGNLARNQGDLVPAFERLESGLALYRELDDGRGVVRALNGLAIAENVRGDMDAARRQWEESLSIARSIGDRRNEAAVLGNLGLLARQEKDLDRTRAMLQEALTVFREVGDLIGVGATLNNLGVDAFDRGDLDRARELYEESLALDRELGNRRGIAQSMGNLGLIAAARGDLEEARQRLEEALRICRETGDRQSVAQHLISLAFVLHGEGRSETAARVLGAADAFLDRIGVSYDRGPDTGYGDTTARLKETLGEEGYRAAWTAGRSLPLGAAIGELHAARPG